MVELTDKLPLKRLREPFRNWRRSRPFWAGVFVMFGGAVIILVPPAPLPIMLELGPAAIAGVGSVSYSSSAGCSSGSCQGTGCPSR